MAVVATLSKGYDLEYIWRQVDRGPARDAASYYIQASESGGEPPGRWWGPGVQALGLQPGQVVDRKPYDLLFGERQAPDGTQLGRPPGSGRRAAVIYARLLSAEPRATAERKRELRLEATRQARQSPLFFDLTLSLSKSISIFHASLGENARLARAAGDIDGDEYWSGLVAELRRRHPGQRHSPLRSAEPEPPTPALHEEPALTTKEELTRMDATITNLTAHRRQFARQFAERTRQPLPAGNSDDFGPAFPARTGEARDAILQPPKPQIEPSPRILERVTSHDLDLEAAD